MHTRLSTVVRVLYVIKHLLCIATVPGRERLVPHRIQERVWIWSGVLDTKRDKEERVELAFSKVDIR